MTRRLRTTPPDWTSLYVGVPWRDRGRDRDGLDCWGLVRLVYGERFGIALPDLGGSYGASEDAPSVSRVLGEEAAPAGSWTRREGSPEEVGDVGVFRIRGLPAHVGIAVSDRKILHVVRGANSVVEEFDGPLWGPRVDGWFRFSGPIDVRTRRSIFAPPRRIDLPEGATVEEMIVAGGLDPRSPGVRAWIGDREIDRGHWSTVRPKAGRRVTIAVVPEGSGKDFARILLVIAVIVAAVYLGPMIATGLGFTATGSAAAIASAMVGLAGTLAVNALVPPPKPELSGAGDGASTRSPTITGARNEVRAYAPVPVIYGTHRVTPPFGALPYTEVVGDDQFLRLLFVVGYGPLELSDFRIGETSIDEFDGVEMEVRNGVEGESPTSIYPGIVNEDGESVLLRQADGWVTRTTSGEADEISLDVTFPQGVARIESDGSRTTTIVAIDVEFAPTGSGAWRRVNSVDPSTSRELDVLFRTPESTRLTQGNRIGRINWSASGVFADPAPTEVASRVGTVAAMAWSAEGLVFIPTEGAWRFSIDTADAADLEVDGRIVATFYGTHPRTTAATFGQSGTMTSEAMTLRRGYHKFRLRVQSRTPATMAAALGWSGPNVAWQEIPSTSIFRRTNTGYAAGYIFRLFDNSAFGSTITVADSRVDQVRRSLSWAVPRGQYDLRIRRTTLDSTDERTIDEAYWTAVRTIRNDEPIVVRNLARVALRIKATDQLSGVIDNFNVLAAARIPDWDAESRTWIERTTSNPASIYRAILQGPANVKPVDDSRVALSTLVEWHEANAATGFAANLVFDFAGTLFERLQQVAAAGRATFGMEDGKFSVVRDRVQTTPVQHFTPRNSRGFKGRRTFPDVPHALRVRFLNEEKGYQQDERVVYDDDFDATNATRFETIELFGITNPTLAWRHGRYFLAVGQLRPETYELGVDFEHLVCRRGDLVLVTHDVPLLGSASGRVRQVVATTIGRPAIVELDAPVEMELGRTYGIRFRKKDGTFVLREVVNETGGETSILTFASPIPLGQPAPEAGDLFSFGDLGLDSREMIVKSISMGPDLSATLTLVDHAPAVHSADTGEIPPYESGIVRPPVYEDGPEPPVVDLVRSDDWVMVRAADGTLLPRVVVYLRRPSSSTRPAPLWIQGRYKSTADGGSFRSIPTTSVDGLSVAFFPVEQGEEYSLAIRYVSAIGQVSPWTTVVHTVEGHGFPPPDVESFSVAQLGDGTRRFAWELGNPPPDVIGVRLRYREITVADGDGAAFQWDTMTDLLDGSGVVEGASPTDLAIPSRQAFYRFAVKMVDAGGLESRNALFANARLGPPPRESVALVEDLRAKGWPGTKTNCYVSNGGELAARGRRDWWRTSSPWSLWRSWTEDPYPEITYEHPVVDIGFLLDFSPSFDYSVEGNQPIEIEFRYSEDGETFTPYLGGDAFRGRTVRARYFQVRATVGNAGSYPVPTLHSLTVSIIAPTFVEVLDNLSTLGLSSRYRLGPGHFFAPISSTFASIRTVSVSFNGTGAGWSWEIISKNVATGPELKIYDPSDTATDATVDVTVRGIRSADGSTFVPPAMAYQFFEKRNAVLVATI